jgi:hypothetical protein
VKRDKARAVSPYKKRKTEAQMSRGLISLKISSSLCPVAIFYVTHEREVSARACFPGKIAAEFDVSNGPGDVQPA